MMKCTICKTGETHSGTTTVTLQRDNSVVVIRVYADADATARRHVEVEIQRYAA